MFKAQKPVHIQAFIPEPAVKSFDVGVVDRFARTDVPPFIRPLLLGKNSFAEPEILPVSAFLKNCAGELNCNPPAIAR